MKVIAVKAENIKKLRLVHLDLQGGNLRVSGPPGQGKTTLVELVWAALTKKSLGPKTVQAGKESGFIEIQLGTPGVADTITVRREYDADGTDRLKVKSSKGKTTITDIQRMIQEISFDPLEFYQKKGVEQVNMLLRLLGVDLGDIDTRRKNLYEERTSVGRIARSHRDALSTEPRKAERVSIVELSAKFTEAVEYNRLVDDRHATLQGIKDQRAIAQSKVDALREELKLAIDAKDALEARVAKGTEVCNALVKRDITAVQDAIRQVEETNRAAELHERWMVDSQKCSEHQERYKELEAAIADIDAEKEKKLEGAKWPLPGLSVDGDIVTYEGMPLVQTGESKKLQVSFAIAASLHPELRICRIDGAESLGIEGRNEILRIAEQEDMQVFMARVADGEAEEGEITIENGMATK